MEAIVLAVFPLLVVVEMLKLFKLLYKDPKLQFKSGRINRNQGGCFAKHCKNRGEHKSYFAAIE